MLICKDEKYEKITTAVKKFCEELSKKTPTVANQLCEDNGV